MAGSDAASPTRPFPENVFSSCAAEFNRTTRGCVAGLVAAEEEDPEAEDAPTGDDGSVGSLFISNYTVDFVYRVYVFIKTYKRL
jgi:hypothetical protein